MPIFRFDFPQFLDVFGVSHSGAVVLELVYLVLRFGDQCCFFSVWFDQVATGRRNFGVTCPSADTCETHRPIGTERAGEVSEASGHKLSELQSLPKKPYIII